MPVTRRPQRRAAIQASQQLAYPDSFERPPFAPVDPAAGTARSDASGNRWFTPLERDEERKRTALEEWRVRRVKRRLEVLERTNAHDLPSTAFPTTPLPNDDIPSSASSTTFPTPTDAPTSTIPQSVARHQRRKADKRKRGMMTPTVKTLVQYRKTLREYLNELPPTTQYTNAPSPFPTHPPRKICSHCSHPSGKYACARCGEYACSLACWNAHRALAVADDGCGVGMQGMVGFGS